MWKLVAMLVVIPQIHIWCWLHLKTIHSVGLLTVKIRESKNKHPLHRTYGHMFSYVSCRSIGSNRCSISLLPLLGNTVLQHWDEKELTIDGWMKPSFLSPAPRGDSWQLHGGLLLKSGIRRPLPPNGREEPVMYCTCVVCGCHIKMHLAVDGNRQYTYT